MPTGMFLKRIRDCLHVWLDFDLLSEVCEEEIQIALTVDICNILEDTKLVSWSCLGGCSHIVESCVIIKIAIFWEGF